MPTGDGHCPTCGQYNCICGLVLRNLFNNHQNQYLPDTAKVINLINEIEQLGCSCDITCDRTCDIHDKIREVKDILISRDTSIKN